MMEEGEVVYEVMEEGKVVYEDDGRGQSSV